MANLKAHGAELARVKAIQKVDDPSDCVAERITYRALMRDGWILQKNQVRWREPQLGEQGLHDYGWKRLVKIKPGLTPREWGSKYLAAKKHTWVIERMALLLADKPVIPTQYTKQIELGQTTLE